MAHLLYTPSSISQIIGSIKTIMNHQDLDIDQISYDTRELTDPIRTLFFALDGSIHDGHYFINHAIDLGVCNIVCQVLPESLHHHVNYYQVENSLRAFQIIAAYHRSQFPDLPVIGITGSNGKTMVKEWVNQMLVDRIVVKSPKSYNSQIGVPLSVWQITESDEIGIFEAGISTLGEMKHLSSIIRPTMGVFLNLGDAHDAGFPNREVKLAEKMKLFEFSEQIICCSDQQNVVDFIKETYQHKKVYSWGWENNPTLLKVNKMEVVGNRSVVNIIVNEVEKILIIPFTDEASIENCLHCVAICLLLEYSIDEINDRLRLLKNIPMRLEMKYGRGRCLIINDSYIADVNSLVSALNFLVQQSGDRERILVISDFVQVSDSEVDFYHNLAGIIKRFGISNVVAIGKKISTLRALLDIETSFSSFKNKEDAITFLMSQKLDDSAILVKGAREFGLEKIVEALVIKNHSTTLEIDMHAIDHNLRFFSDMLTNNSKIIPIIKASAYGSGSEELARFLQHRKVPSIAVAYTDEGVYLRGCGIDLPIIILNPEEGIAQTLIEYNLEPEVYSLEQLSSLINVIQDKDLSIHIKVDTGMHRLGFMVGEVDKLCVLLSVNRNIHVISIFSHLSGSEDASLDDYTHYQARLFDEMYHSIAKTLGYKPKKHLLNSAGILRFPKYHFDWVRLGLGLYGIDSTGIFGSRLEKAHTLKANVIQVKHIHKNDTVGYNRRGKVFQNSFIAVVNIGYADGLRRAAGNGMWSAMIHGKNYPTIGNICMDLMMLDLGPQTDVKVNDEVVIFGKNKPIEELALACNTIPYEIISTISQRVKRIYTQS